MKRLLYTGIIFLYSILAFSQNSSPRTFWRETFNKGVIPAGWRSVAMNDSDVVWKVTDQPYPGSYGRNYQAPPLASRSRGYYLMVSPGVKVGKHIRQWEKAGLFPDAYIESPAIDCSGKKSVVLRFAQNFFWGKWEHTMKRVGLLVGVSHDGKTWKNYDVHNGIGPAEDCPNPMNVELNITREAAGYKKVYLRFWWHHMYQWYWMIDDVTLSEGYDKDIEALSLSGKHHIDGNTFGKSDTLSFKIVNLGAYPVRHEFDCYLQIDQRPLLKEEVHASKEHPFGIIDTMEVRFKGLDLTDIGIHKIKFFSALPGDMRTSNDTLSMELYSKAYPVGDVTKFGLKKDTVYIQCHRTKFRIQFLRDDMFRIWMAYNGIFTNPAGHDIVINTPKDSVHVKMEDKGDYYLMQTPDLSLRAYKHPLHFALYKSDNHTLIWEEVKGITYGKQTIQYLKRGINEQFYCGGMQNGRFSFRGKVMKLNINYDWKDGGNPNPATFYMSTMGYGAMRNTYATGYYSFKDTVELVQNESRFDCYYFVGNSLKTILNDYTDITGKPFLLPIWGLGMGDANCYNRGAKSYKSYKNKGSTSTGYDGLTPSVIHLIADKYIKEKMPRGWILPNDGYGCGYTKLDSVVKALHQRGFYTGLWTGNGVAKIAREVGIDGVRLFKLDVAWVGTGFQFAMNAAKTAYEGIENNSNARGFVWMVSGWTGVQRYAVLWTGDEKGSWNYIRWEIPTEIGAGLSGQNYATSDLDGIFGGSDSTYTRDLEWKSFTPVFMAMSGWATNNKDGIKDKQPWLFGEPYTSINRKYLQLKERMTPYMYTLCHIASQTGVPAVRALVLEYPKDTMTWGAGVNDEFLLGKNLLVAPVYEPKAFRDSIYLPHGTWIDYWSGERYKGNTTLMHYPAPLDKLPLFVRGGAIIPMYQPMMYNWERPIDTLTLDIYPQGHSSFTMYEDDGVTRAYRKGAFALTRFEVTVSKIHPKDMSIILHAAKGNYKGREKQRVYLLEIHTGNKPRAIRVDGILLKRQKDSRSLARANSGWYYDPGTRYGILHIKTEKLSTDHTTTLTIR